MLASSSSIFFSNSPLATTPKTNLIGTPPTTATSTRFRHKVTAALNDNDNNKTTTTTTTSELDNTKPVPPSSAEDVTKKYGLEAGLWKIFSSSGEEEEEEGKKTGKGEEAKQLLAKYGGAYLATSITLSIISFSLCYALVSVGVDVSALLTKVGITSNDTGEKVGTFALAYAAHKAASPIRFPPTVALTPIVASWINNTTKNQNNQNQN